MRESERKTNRERERERERERKRDGDGRRDIDKKKGWERGRER